MKPDPKKLAALVGLGEKDKPKPDPELATRKPTPLVYYQHGIFVFRTGRGWA